ncbi:predicted protein [Streptomyces viridochromogenes DSM 40736]|uniref:Predicted protein n=1 Tax=Streptomyces viridochromogenes (strain DSM 40736 / JCM 4977 / BCRC 1201 / Tue 494) TaxID=591159 RepID=D9WZB2_STRVT|nr:predicted protein [Streptomyces viridochromogenes DSM 40736]
MVRHAWSLTAWWLLLVLALWLLGQAVGQTSSLTACAASSAFLIGIGEIGDWLRRPLAAHRRRTGPATKRSRSMHVQG